MVSYSYKSDAIEKLKETISIIGESLMEMEENDYSNIVRFTEEGYSISYAEICSVWEDLKYFITIVEKEFFMM